MEEILKANFMFYIHLMSHKTVIYLRNGLLLHFSLIKT